jgi:hypothetical protein
MHETPEDLVQLQHLLDRSIAQAGVFLRDSFQMPGHSLSAHQLTTYFVHTKNVALATVTARGEPRVAPIGAMLVHGQFVIPTVATAARTRHLQQRPAVSLTHFVESSLAIICHGHATVVPAEEPLFATLDTVYRAITGDSPLSWGEGVYLRIDAHQLYTYARRPDLFPEHPQSQNT